QTTPISSEQQLPSPMTAKASIASESYKEATLTPPQGRSDQAHQPSPVSSPSIQEGLSSPPPDTQAFSQFVYQTQSLSDEVKDEEEEGVWGYLLPLDNKFGKSLVLRKGDTCSLPGKKVDSSKGS